MMIVKLWKLLLLVCLSACNRVEYISKPYKIPPPEVYLELRKIEKCNTNVIDCYLSLQAAIELSNQDKKAIISFYKR